MLLAKYNRFNTTRYIRNYYAYKKYVNLNETESYDTIASDLFITPDGSYSYLEVIDTETGKRVKNPYELDMSKKKSIQSEIREVGDWWWKNEPDPFEKFYCPETNDPNKLEEWKNFVLSCKEYDILKLYTTNSIDSASKNGNIDVLNWWKNSGLELKYTEYALSYAAFSKHFHILEWWKNSNLIIKQDDQLISNLIQVEFTDVLEWFKIVSAENQGIKFNFDHNIINYLLRQSRFLMLDWFKNSGLKVEYPLYALDTGTMLGNIKVLDWLLNSGLNIEYTPYNPNNTMTNIDKVRMQHSSDSQKIRYTNDAVTYASLNGNIEMLDWWWKSELGFKYDHNAIDSISFGIRSKQRLDALNWWKSKKEILDAKYSGLQYTEEAMDTASANGYDDVLDWFKESGLPLKFSNKAVSLAEEHGHKDTVNWWMVNKHLLDKKKFQSE